MTFKKGFSATGFTLKKGDKGGWSVFNRSVISYGSKPDNKLLWLELTLYITHTHIYIYINLQTKIQVIWTKFAYDLRGFQKYASLAIGKKTARCMGK